MSNETLQAFGEALRNIGGSIAECVRADVPNTPSQTHVDHVDACLQVECRRLRSIGMDGVASAIEASRAPLVRLIMEGW